MQRTIMTVLAFCLTLTLEVQGASWPQFQGPERNGVSPETGLAVAWPEGGPKLLWKYEKMGTGYAGAVIDAGKVYVMDRVADQQDVLRCFDLTTGAQEWTYAYDAPGKNKGGYNGSRNMPAVDASNVFILGPMGDLHCISKQTHQPLWKAQLVNDFGVVLSNWALCQSPVIYKETVILAPLSNQAGLVAFDKASGKLAWKSEPLGGGCWTSPLVVNIEGLDQVLVLCNRNKPRLCGLDAGTGKVLWSYTGWVCPNPITSPLFVGDGRIFITGGYGSGCALIKVQKEGDTWKTTELFKNKNCGAQATNPVFYKDHIYANSNNTNSGVTCLDLKGEIKWKTANTNQEEIGSILVADDKLYSFLSEQGVLRLIEAKPEAYKELSSATITKGINMWAPMALSDGKLLVRNKFVLYCFDVATGK